MNEYEWRAKDLQRGTETRILQRVNLSLQWFPKATENISLVLMNVLPVHGSETLLDYHNAHETTDENHYNFYGSLLKSIC